MIRIECGNMPKIVKSSVCMCTNSIFECLSSTIRCLKCGVQRITSDYEVIYEEDIIIDEDTIKKNIGNLETFFRKLERERKIKQQSLERLEKIRQREIKRLEIIKKQRFIEEKKKASRKIEQFLEDNFLFSRRVWKDKYTKWIDENEFNEILANFVISWFERQGWEKPDIEQARCISEVWTDVQVIARAGSGKTRTIVNRAAFLVKHCGISPTSILLLAFNREAAKEVNNRLHKMLGNGAPQAMTFHALAYALVHPEETLLFDDELEGYKKSGTVQQVIDTYIHSQTWSEIIKDFMLKYFKADWDKIVNFGYHLTPKEMIEYRRSLPYLGLDGTHYKSMAEKRIADYLFEHDVPYKYEKNFWWNGINYKPDFTISLTNQQLKGIVIEYFGMVGDKEYDVQSKAKREYWKTRSDYGFFEIFPFVLGSLEEFLEEKLLEFGVRLRRLTDEEIWHRIKKRSIDEFSLLVSQFIGRCRKLMISPEELLEKVLNENEEISKLQHDFLQIVQPIYESYLYTLSMNNEEDFDGLLYRAIEIISSGQGRWQRKSGSGDLSKIKYLFIDEYQDFSLLFYQLISAIKKINKEVKLFCVGDDWQAINGFAGSDLKFFTNFKDFFPMSKQMDISTNYRSYQSIIDVGNQLMINEGSPSKSALADKGNVWVVNMDHFTPNDFERNFYNGDIVTPALIRLVYYFIQRGQKVALLSRRGSGLPWYTPYNNKKGKFHIEFLEAIRKSLPEDYRPMVVAMDTVHSYKGKEELAVIVVDAVNRSFPLIHPRNIFFEVLGYSIDRVISEEKRLFYVALSRAMKSLVFLTERGNMSPFLLSIVRNSVVTPIDPNTLDVPKRIGNHFIVRVTNKYSYKDTYNIKSHLNENKYQWNHIDKAWTKHFEGKGFSPKWILNESWVGYAENVNISVHDEFDNITLNISIVDGKII